MRLRVAYTLSEVYRELLQLLLNDAPRVSPRGQPCREILDMCVEIHAPTSHPITTADPERNNAIARYTNAEFGLYDRMSDDANEFAKYAPFWKLVANDDGTVNSAYGRIIWKDATLGVPVRCTECYGAGHAYAKPEKTCYACGGAGRVARQTPWGWARQQLERDPETRQAVLLFLRPDHLRECKDVVCTCHGWFAIRDDALHLTMVMRSNDVVKGFVYDAPWFVHLQERMAKEVGRRVGVYTHIAHSMHLYERDIDVARRMAGIAAD